MRILEVCAGDLASAQAAAQGGAHRIELCSALHLDGLTPSAETIEAARRIKGLKLHVLI
ncbi:MAG: copper homeostasis protein CutC, partial [Bacteroidales bacterium]|nr:copper homeostasis protein CutC [Bacteroidales bacterium]